MSLEFLEYAMPNHHFWLPLQSVQRSDLTEARLIPICMGKRTKKKSQKGRIIKDYQEFIELPVVHVDEKILHGIKFRIKKQEGQEFMHCMITTGYTMLV